MAPPSPRTAVMAALLASVCLVDTVRGIDVSMSGDVTYVTWTYNASSTIAKTADINTNSTGTAYAFACNSASSSYSEAISSFSKNRNRSTSVIPTFTTSFPYTSAFWDTYTVDCQNITHAHGTTPLSSYVYYKTTTYTNYTPTAGNTYPGPSPSCHIEPDDCKAVQSSYSKESSAFDRFTSSYTPPYYVVNPPAIPSCSTVCTAKRSCMIKGDHVRVIYWPVTTTGADSCRSNGITVSATATGNRTIESLGTTFTSPSVYLSFRSLSAYDWGCHTQIGEGISNTIIAIPPESLSSAVGGHLQRSAVSYNLADLNGYVSSAAFFRMQGYDWSGPGTIIYDDLYFPSVWMPDAVLTMRPEWSTCEISRFGVNDPPIALAPVEFLTSETPTATSKPSSATPVAGLSNTNAPKTTATALQNQDKGSSLATKSAGDADLSKGNASATQATSATSSANIGGVIASAIASAIGYSRPASAVTITTVKIISIISNGVVDGTKTMPVSILLPGAQIPESAMATGRSQVSDYQVMATTDSSGQTIIVAGEQTLSISGSAMTIDGHTLSAASNGVVVDGDGTTIQYATISDTDSANSTSSSPSSSTSSISFSTNSASTSSAAASSTTSSSAAHVRAQWPSSVARLIFGISIVYGLR